MIRWLEKNEEEYALLNNQPNTGLPFDTVALIMSVLFERVSQYKVQSSLQGFEYRNAGKKSTMK